MTSNKSKKNDKSTVKYTFERSKEDLEKLKVLRANLKREHSWNSFNTDSEIYRKLPDLYLDAVKDKQDLRLDIDKLTAKMNQLVDLRTHFCRIFEICTKKEDTTKTTKKNKVKKCTNFDSGDNDCEKCDGYNTKCDFYDTD